MKKIFVILLILFVGLLVGCASKSVVVKDFSTSFENSEEEKVEEVPIWAGYSANHILPLSLDFPKYKDDYLWLHDISNFDEYFLLPENLTCGKPIRKPYLIRIVKNSDKDKTFFSRHRIVTSARPEYITEFVVPAHSTRYIKSLVTKTTTRFFISYKKTNGGYSSLGAYDIDYVVSINGISSSDILNEILQSHCIEVLFYGEGSEDNVNWLVELPESYDEKELMDVEWIYNETYDR